MSEAGGKKVVIITGAARGIGRAFARRLASDGYRVMIADLNAEQGEETKREIAATGAEVGFVKTDMSDEASALAMAAATMKQFGGIDALINNAGIVNLPRTPLWELAVSEWDRIMSLNARGVWLGIKAVVPAMRERGGGAIVNISSNTFLSGRAGAIHYVASKGACVGITRAAARELGEFKIRVNAILPGSVITETRRGTVDPVRAQQLLDNQSIKREEIPEDLIGTAAFLLSSDAGFMTGQSLNVDGGYLFL